MTHICCKSPYKLNGREFEFGKGGVALIWHKTLSQYIQIIETNSERLVMIKLVLPSQVLYVSQVYLPCSSNTLENFKEKVNKINDLISVIDYSSELVLMWDFNSNILSENGRKCDKLISKIITSKYLKVVTGTSLCTGNGYSFIPGTNLSIPMLCQIIYTGQYNRVPSKMILFEMYHVTYR